MSEFEYRCWKVECDQCGKLCETEGKTKDDVINAACVEFNWDDLLDKGCIYCEGCSERIRKQRAIYGTWPIIK